MHHGVSLTNSYEISQPPPPTEPTQESPQIYNIISIDEPLPLPPPPSPPTPPPRPSQKEQQQVKIESNNDFYVQQEQQFVVDSSDEIHILPEQIGEKHYEEEEDVEEEEEEEEKEEEEQPSYLMATRSRSSAVLSTKKIVNESTTTATAVTTTAVKEEDDEDSEFEFEDCEDDDNEEEEGEGEEDVDDEEIVTDTRNSRIRNNSKKNVLSDDESESYEQNTVNSGKRKRGRPRGKNGTANSLSKQQEVSEKTNRIESDNNKGECEILTILSLRNSNSSHNGAITN